MKPFGQISSIISPRSRLLTAFIVLFIFFANQTNGQETRDGVNISWQELYLYHEFGEKWEMGVLFNTFVDFDYGFFDWFVEGKISYQILTWLEAEAMYRQEYYKISLDSSNWTYEQRPMLRFSSKFKIGNFKFRQRNRGEMRMFELLNTSFRYRGDLRIKYPTELTSFNLSPYIIEEWFVGKRGYSRNRLYFGISGNKGRFSPVMYMLLQSSKGKERWFSKWICGVALDIRI